MSKLRMTPWFAASERPTREGWYEIKGARFSGRNFRYWLQDGWSATYSSPRGECIRRVYAPGEDMTGWRGAVEPTGATQ